MQNFNFTVKKEGDKKRLDAYLVEAFKKEYSRSFLKKLINSDKVSINGKARKAHYLVREGEVVDITLPDPQKLELKPEKIDLDILYEDPDLIVINKPPGLVAHPAPGHYSGTLVNGILYHCGDLSGIGGVLRPGIVHRLDKDTSGVMVVAKSDFAQRALSSQFKKRTVEKIYIALVNGLVQLDNDIINMPISRHTRDRKKMAVNFSSSKEATTIYKVLKRFKDFTMLEIKLTTGRTHQIRVHMAHVGHSVLGDKTYGSGKGLGRQALHAKSLGFTHPRTKKYVQFDTEIPKDMQEVIDRGVL